MPLSVSTDAGMQTKRILFQHDDAPAEGKCVYRPRLALRSSLVTEQRRPAPHDVARVRNPAAYRAVAGTAKRVNL